MPERFYLLDFDGVICDSREECLITSLNAYRRLGGTQVLELDGQSIAPEARALFWKYRFLVRTGREFKLLWDLIEAGQPISATELIRDQTRVDEAELETYHGLFYSARSEWRARDPEGWRGANLLFVEIAAKAVRWMEADRLAIVSSKDKASILELMGSGGFPLRESIVLDVEDGKDKTDFFAEIEETHRQAEVVFVDDHIENLMMARPFSFKLYLATWGYTTAEIIEDAPRHGIEPISRAEIVAGL